MSEPRTEARISVLNSPFGNRVNLVGTIQFGDRYASIGSTPSTADGSRSLARFTWRMISARGRL